MRNILLILLCLVFCGTATACAEENTLYVKAVEGLPEDFIFGMDVSSVIALENAGVRYHDSAGTERDLFELLKENGVDWIRVRVWVNPYDDAGHGFGGGNNDLAAAIEIGKRASAAGQRLFVDFHYSDFWADPGKQMPPRAWEAMNIDEKAAALYRYTADSLTELKKAGADVGMVQIGNETNGRFCGENDWQNIAALMGAGAKAVREILPDALVCVHFTNPENGDALRSWAHELNSRSLDYDVFATSYYPYWHGTLDNLTRVLADIRESTGKAVMVAETSYAWTLEDGDFSGNTIGEGGAYEHPWAFSVQGQANAVRDVTDAVVRAGGIGVFYWEGAWVPTGGSTWEENHKLWEKYGTGWASSYAAVYDPDDAGKYYGGCACDNQALFDFSAKALDSLGIFRLMRKGQEAAVVPTSVKDASINVLLGNALHLPDTVEAVMTDNSRTAISAAWDQASVDKVDIGREGKYTVTGTAAGMPVTCTVTVSARNYLRNAGFESPDTSWRATDLGKTAQLYREEKAVDSKEGKAHWHFYSAPANSVRFILEQDVKNVPAGTYTYTISVMGGDCGAQTVYSYVLINGTETARCETSFTKWNEWHTAVIDGIAVAEGDAVTVGLYVECAGPGAWGKIDEASFK